jgi:hypothetical protein
MGPAQSRRFPSSLAEPLDVGDGRRIGNGRTALARVIHVDVAFPLGGDPSIAQVQVPVGTKVGLRRVAVRGGGG